MICPEHGVQAKLVPAGVSKKTGKAYTEFWACPEPGCRAKVVEEGTMLAKGPAVLKAEAAARHFTKQVAEEATNERWDKIGEQKNRSNLAAAVLHGKPLDWKQLQALEAWVLSGKTPDELGVDIDSIPF